MEGSLTRFLVLRETDELVGTIGIDLLGNVALLRSMVVANAWQGRGAGRQLTVAAEAFAQRGGAKKLYLLTTTAAHFFSAVGYRAISRDDAPLAIQETTQFKSLCPSTATLMSK